MLQQKFGRAMTDDCETAFAAGQDAFDHCELQSDCPYAEGSELMKWWMLGYDEARRFAIWLQDSGKTPYVEDAEPSFESGTHVSHLGRN